MDFLYAIGLGAAGGTYRATQIPFALGLAAVQTAAVIAAPVPKGYKGGRLKDVPRPREIAYVGDGGKPEVITDSEGLNPRITPNKATLTLLEKGDLVHKSVGDYQKYVQDSFFKNMSVDYNRNQDFMHITNNNFSDSGIIDKLDEFQKELINVVKNSRPVIVNVPGVDWEHEQWKLNQGIRKRR